MTIEELKEYDALSEKDKSSYHRIKSLHPEWNHKQIMIKIAVSGVIDGGIGYGESLWDKLKDIFR